VRKIVFLGVVLLVLLAACSNPLADAQELTLEGYATVKAPTDWVCKLQYEDEILCQSPDVTQAVLKVMPMADALPGGNLGEVSLGSAAADYWPSNLISDSYEMEAITVGGKPAFQQCYDTHTGFHCCAIAAGEESAPVFMPYCAPKDLWRSYNRVFKAMLKAIEF